MSDDPIRDYLGELGKELGRFARHRRRTLAEVEDHLREAACVLQERGMTAEGAAREAIVQLGSPAAIVPTAGRDPMRVVAAWALVTVVLVALAGAFALGRSTAPHHRVGTYAMLSRATLVRLADTCVGLENKLTEERNALTGPNSTGQIIQGTRVFPRHYALTRGHIRFILEPCVGTHQRPL